VGKSRALRLGRASIHERHELVVNTLANHCDELFSHGVRNTILTNERRGVLGAPPVEVGTTGAPVTAVPLRDARDDVSVVFDLIVAS